jgi:hypothetical protein
MERPALPTYSPPVTEMGIDDAIQLAYRLHDGQVDKDGADYVEHLLRVAVRCDTEEEKIVALLHDALEDTNVTVDELRAAGLSEPQLLALQTLCHDDSEPYLDYVDRVTKIPLACRVKFADLSDNTDPERLARLDEPTRARLQSKYRPAMVAVRDALGLSGR